MIAFLGRLLAWPLTWLLILFVFFYRGVIRPMLPPLCRFEPSCSEYFLQAVKKYGPVCGAAKGVWRICRCNPWCMGGYDPP